MDLEIFEQLERSVRARARTLRISPIEGRVRKLLREGVAPFEHVDRGP